jgi:hypothetical protein
MRAADIAARIISNFQETGEMLHTPSFNHTLKRHGSVFWRTSRGAALIALFPPVVTLRLIFATTERIGSSDLPPQIRTKRLPQLSRHFTHLNTPPKPAQWMTAMSYLPIFCCPDCGTPDSAQYRMFRLHRRIVHHLQSKTFNHAPTLNWCGFFFSQ